MASLPTACAANALLLILLSACASSPTPGPPQRPDAPAEMMTPAPPPGYFTTKLESILSRSFAKPKPLPIASEPAKPASEASTLQSP